MIEMEEGLAADTSTQIYQTKLRDSPERSIFHKEITFELCAKPAI
jgi:hypothetical protein